MLEIFRKFNWLRAFFAAEDDSARLARERLRLVLIQDQAGISPGLMSLLRDEMIGVVSRYLEIDSARLEMGIERKDEKVALAASIPILRIRKEGRIAGNEPVLAQHGNSLPEAQGERPRYRRSKRRAH